MRPSKTPNHKTGTLLIDGPLGVEWLVEDARFQSIGMGVVPATLELSAGLYTVTWSAAGRSEERLVRVIASEEIEERGGDFSLGGAAPSNLPSASKLERDQFAAVAKALETPSPSAESEILVLVRSANDRPSSDLGRSLRLYDHDGEAMRSKSRTRKSGARNALQFAVRNYSIPTGNYVLRYEASDRRTLEQSVYAFPGRRTIVFLKYGTSVIAQSAGSSTQFRRRRGIDPSQTTVLSTDLTSHPDIEYTSRLADILLHKLATHEPVLESVVSELIQESGDDDPYIKIYAAALLLNVNPADEGVKSKLERSAERTLKFLDGVETSCPDVLCLKCAAEVSLGGTGRDWIGQLATPPMLDISWRWAAALSVSVPLLADNPIFATVSRVTQPTPPWLTWPARALAYGESRQSLLRPKGAVDDLVSALAEKAASLQERSQTDPDRPTRRLKISSSTAKFANAAISVSGSRSGGNIAQQLAFSTGSTFDSLTEQLEDALSEISEQIESND